MIRGIASAFAQRWITHRPKKRSSCAGLLTLVAFAHHRILRDGVLRNTGPSPPTIYNYKSIVYSVYQECM